MWFFPVWFFHVWIRHIWIFHVWIFPMWRDGETPDLRSERRSSMREYRNMTSPSKAAYSERKRQKSTFILTVNSPVYPPIQGKENRLFLRPFIAAKETGGLDFLIAHALLIVCHSLFEVVIGAVLKDKIVHALTSLRKNISYVCMQCMPCVLIHLFFPKIYRIVYPALRLCSGSESETV